MVLTTFWGPPALRDVVIQRNYYFVNVSFVNSLGCKEDKYEHVFLIHRLEHYYSNHRLKIIIP